MTKEEEKKWYKRVALAGAALALVCHFLPPDYQAVCHAIANVCTGGL